jgi:hypothetical protein
MRTPKALPLISVARQLVDRATRDAFRQMIETAAARRTRSTGRVVRAFNRAMREKLAWLEGSSD